MATAKLKPYPFPFDGAVIDNAAIRVVRMVKPECPNDPRPEIVLRNGDVVPNPRYTGEPNCMEIYKINNMGRWEIEKCEALGHDPYHFTVRTRITEEVEDPETGLITETRTRIRREKRLNVVQVSLNVRHTSGQEVRLALAKGYKPIEEFGFEAPCQFRNCTKPVKVRVQYGDYCSERHARLIAADQREIGLIVSGDPYSEDKAMRQRQEQLEGIQLTKRGE